MFTKTGLIFLPSYAKYNKSLGLLVLGTLGLSSSQSSLFAILMVQAVAATMQQHINGLLKNFREYHSITMHVHYMKRPGFHSYRMGHIPTAHTCTKIDSGMTL